MVISLIAAVAKNRVIGFNGQLPWHLPGDLKRFKALTWGQTLLMGRRTCTSIGGPLPGRRTLVLSRNPDFVAPGYELVGSLSKALEQAGNVPELFVCGGEDLYRQTLPLATRLYLTELDAEVEGDRYFPTFPRTEFKIVSEEPVADAVSGRFVILQRKKPTEL